MNINQLIINKIIKNGPINVGEFIQMCQFENNGYYLENNPIGSKNDFITAPEISQMFGEILGVFLINYWNKKINSKFNLIELGAGKGTLLKDILRVSSINQNFLNASNITIVERNKFLKKIQMDLLSSYNICWNEEFNIEKKNIPSIIYSNEFFDCFPVRQFYKNKIWYEKLIKYNDSIKNLTFVSHKVEEKNILKTLEKFDDVKVAEISESRNRYFKLICKFIRQYKGIFVTIDYGYKNPPSNLSLQTICNHKKTHLFENLGNQDITAYVDFDKLIFLANEQNLKIDLFCSQKDFLISYGIKERMKKLKKNKDKDTIKKLNLEYERLVDSSQMGKIFKILVISCL